MLSLHSPMHNRLKFCSLAVTISRVTLCCDQHKCVIASHVTRQRARDTHRERQTHTERERAINGFVIALYNHEYLQGTPSNTYGQIIWSTQRDEMTMCYGVVGLSASCSACWIAEGHCTLRHCMPVRPAHTHSHMHTRTHTHALTHAYTLTRTQTCAHTYTHLSHINATHTCTPRICT